MEYNRETVDDVNVLPVLAWPERGLTAETMKHFGIRTALSEKDGKTREAVYFPITHEGKLVGYKKKDLTKPKGAKGHFTVIGSASIDCDLFGQAQCNGGKKIIFCEGEIDAASLWQEMKSRYPQGNPNVVSIIMGTANAAKNIAKNQKFWNKYGEKILCFDQDKATHEEVQKGILKGWDATAEVCSLFTDFLHVEFEEKDANDMVMAGKGETLFWSVMKHAKKFQPEDIYNAGDVDLEELMKPLPKGVSIRYPKLNKMCGGLRKGELVVSTAASGSGKSTLAKEVLYELLTEHNMRIGAIFLEEPKVKTLKSFVAMHNDIPANKVFFDSNVLTKSQWEQSRKELYGKGNFHGIDHFGSLTADSLIQKIRWLALVKGCDWIFLDHISLVISGIDSGNERKDIDMLMTKLATVVNELGIGIWSIVHLSRRPGKQSASEGGQVSLTDLRGSASLEQLSWIVLAYERDTQAEGADAHKGRIRILKNRTMGMLGLADECEYDMVTGRLNPVVEEF